MTAVLCYINNVWQIPSAHFALSKETKNQQGSSLPFFALSVFLQSVEKMPSVQSFVATSSRPNI